jgi:hypothetical protein
MSGGTLARQPAVEPSFDLKTLNCFIAESKLEKLALSVTSLLEARGERSSRMSQCA